MITNNSLFVMSIFRFEWITPSELFQNEDKFEDGQAIFKGLLSSAINSLNDQTDAWKTFLESQRDFLTCSASKTDEVCALYTDNYSSPLQTSFEET